MSLRELGAVLAIATTIVGIGRTGWATDDRPSDSRLFVRLAAGPGFNYERWSPEGGSPGASYTGWGPALNVAVGRRMRRGLVVAGDLQLATIVDRTERYLGGSYPLADTLHFLDMVEALVDYSPRSRPYVHFGGGLGVIAATDVDTNMGSVKTGWGWAISAHGGVRRHLAGNWSIGVLGRLTFYRFGSDSPPPSSASVGLLPVVLMTFTR